MAQNWAEHHASVTVNAPLHQVYSLFSHFNDFPKFMSFVAASRAIGDLELALALTLMKYRGMIYMFPKGEPPGKQRDPGIWREDSHWYSERRTLCQ